MAEQHQAGDAAPARIGVREVAAEVTEREGAQERLADGVREHVGVGVAVEADLGRQRHPAEHERAAPHQRMQIEAEAHPGHRRRSRARRRSSGVVILTLPARPGTTRTA